MRRSRFCFCSSTQGGFSGWIPIGRFCHHWSWLVIVKVEHDWSRLHRGLERHNILEVNYLEVLVLEAGLRKTQQSGGQRSRATQRSNQCPFSSDVSAAFLCNQIKELSQHMWVKCLCVSFTSNRAAKCKNQPKSRNVRMRCVHATRYVYAFICFRQQLIRSQPTVELTLNTSERAPELMWVKKKNLSETSVSVPPVRQRGHAPNATNFKA